MPETGSKTRDLVYHGQRWSDLRVRWGQIVIYLVLHVGAVVAPWHFTWSGLGSV